VSTQVRAVRDRCIAGVYGGYIHSIHFSAETPVWPLPKWDDAKLRACI